MVPLLIVESVDSTQARAARRVVVLAAALPLILLLPFMPRPSLRSCHASRWPRLRVLSRPLGVVVDRRWTHSRGARQHHGVSPTGRVRRRRPLAMASASPESCLLPRPLDLLNAADSFSGMA